jgi:hypothetical protein
VAGMIVHQHTAWGLVRVIRITPRMPVYRRPARCSGYEQYQRNEQAQHSATIAAEHQCSGWKGHVGSEDRRSQSKLSIDTSATIAPILEFR